jgi:protein-L-isoaspartate O-methyltransferase
MSFYQRRVLPYLLHLAMRQKQLLPFRRRVIGAVEGRVLEIGIGSGLNLPLYGSSARSVIGLEPSPELLRMALKRAGNPLVAIEFLKPRPRRCPSMTAASILS